MVVLTTTDVLPQQDEFESFGLFQSRFNRAVDELRARSPPHDAERIVGALFHLKVREDEVCLYMVIDENPITLALLDGGGSKCVEELSETDIRFAIEASSPLSNRYASLGHVEADFEEWIIHF